MPILMLTAHTEASRVAAARDAGVSGFIKKPISARLLFDRVANALTDTRAFVRAADFFGPDRRRGETPGYAGPWRRESDTAAAYDTFDLDTLRVA
jgi:DNA-binding response OmpR family regulator